MSYLWIIAAVIVLLLVFARVRKRRRPSPVSRSFTGPRIIGYRVHAYLHPKMSAACLFDHGIQFGRGFRRKAGPVLPHDENCQCETVPFSFTSSEVFKGALRGSDGIKCCLPEFPASLAVMLLDRLKALETGRVDRTLESYLNQMNIPSFPAQQQKALRGFVEERFGFQTGKPASAPAGK